MELGFEASEEILLYSIYVVLALKKAVLGNCWEIFNVYHCNYSFR